MKRRIDEIINGKFEYAHPTLVLSNSSIQATADQGQSFQGQLTVSASDGRKIKGYVVSNHRRVLFSKDEFYGKSNLLNYGVDVTGMRPGEHIEGKISIITEIGLYHVPFYFSVGKEESKYQGKLKYLSDLCALARNDYQEAIRVFQNLRKYTSIWQSMERTDRAYYELLAREPVSGQNLEEYLVGSGLKNAVFLRLMNKDIVLDGLRETIEEHLSIYKNTWGYVRIDVFSTGAFIELEKAVITAEDFIGSVYHLPFLIRADRMNPGRNYGRIILKTPGQELSIEVMVTSDQKVYHTVEKNKRAELMDLYIRLRTHQLDYKSWMRESREVLAELKKYTETPAVCMLYQAYLDYHEEEYEEANTILDQYEERELYREDITLAAAYVYLSYLLERESDKRAAEQKLYRYYLQQEHNALLFWMWQDLSEEVNGSDRKKLFILQEEYEHGLRSPLLYVEVWNIIRKNNDLIRTLDGMWLQVMAFASSHGILTEEVSRKIMHLSGNRKQFSPLLLRLLNRIYNSYPTEEALEAVCKYCIKVNPADPSYFCWYERAVDKKLRLTGLYEYYMETMDLRQKIVLPRSVLLYFAFTDKSLSEEKRTYLYANIVERRESEPEIYKAYEKRIAQFEKVALREGRMNEDYARIYQAHSLLDNLSEEQPELSGLLDMYQFTCGNPMIRRVIVKNARIEGERVYPVSQGVAYPQIHVEDSVIALEDLQNRRYICAVPYELQPLIQKKKTDHLTEEECVDAGLLLSYCDQTDIAYDTLEFFQLVTEKTDFSEDYRNEIRRDILEYFSKNCDNDLVREKFRNLDYAPYAEIDKKVVIETLIRAGLYAQAYEVIRTYGCEAVEINLLQKLIAHLIRKIDWNLDEELRLVSRELYQRGCRDQVILEYLIRYAQGDTDFLIELWKESGKQNLKTRDLEEQILLQMMFTWNQAKELNEIFVSYLKRDTNDRIVLAWLTYQSYLYFVQDKKMDIIIEKCLKTAMRRKWEIDFICRIALLKVIAGKDNLDQEEEEMADQILKECLEVQMFFDFFAHLPVSLQVKNQIEDRVYVQYKGNPEAKVSVYYAMDLTEEETPFRVEAVQNQYMGYYVKVFRLFYGERFRYYFHIEDDQGLEETVQQTIRPKYPEKNGTSKFQRLNRIMYDWKNGEKEHAKQELSEYLNLEEQMRSSYQIEKEP